MRTNFPLLTSYFSSSSSSSSSSSPLFALALLPANEEYSLVDDIRENQRCYENIILSTFADDILASWLTGTPSKYCARNLIFLGE